MNRFCLAILMLLAAAGSGWGAPPDGSLDAALVTVVASVSDYLKAEGYNRLTIGDFAGPPQLGATAGPGIVQRLTVMFAAPEYGIEVTPLGAPVALRGGYVAREGADGELLLVLEGALESALGGVITSFSVEGAADGLVQIRGGKFSAKVQHEEDLAGLLGLTTRLDPRDDLPHDRSRDLMKAVRQSLDPMRPLAYEVDETGHKCSVKGSPYAMEILSSPSWNGSGSVSDWEPALIEPKGHFPFVGLARGDSYAVVLHNGSEYDAAVELRIDGISVFEFSEIRGHDGRPKYKHYILPPHSRVPIKGWHVDNKVVSSFKVTGYADSALARLNQKQGQGTITALFSAAWSPGHKPADESRSRGRGDGGDATGFGPPIEQVSREVNREIGKLRASISIRYTRTPGR